MANLITITRILMVFLTVCLLCWGKESNILYLIAFVIAISAIIMDAMDGYVARKYNLTSKFGAVLDIIGDRLVENVFWISFMALGWIPLIVPLIVITRGIIVDGIRSVALEHGMTAFGQSTMMKSKLGKFLVASKFSRGTYAAFKGIAFGALILINVPNWHPDLIIVKTFLFYLAYASVYITLFFCIIRGLPVIIEGKRFLEEDNNKDHEPQAVSETSTESIA